MQSEPQSDRSRSTSASIKCCSHLRWNCHRIDRLADRSHLGELAIRFFRHRPRRLSRPPATQRVNRRRGARLTKAERGAMCNPVSRPDGRSAPMPKGGRGGKSGLHGQTVPDNVRRGQTFTGCGLRDSATENRPPRLRSVLAAVRVKRCGKSAPRCRQRQRHGKPHREQDRIGMARGFGLSPVRASHSGRLLDAPGNRRARGMAVTFAVRSRFRGDRPRAIQNPAYRPADTSNGGSAAKTVGPPPIFGAAARCSAACFMHGCGGANHARRAC